ncbi:MAG: MbcA/ParS/Xre antitoxin family protein [Bryobacteraceae bacterium]|nr:MbcA/ParS/Xre antitoxin family protein [Bryobacteraceae bacterium]
MGLTLRHPISTVPAPTTAGLLMEATRVFGDSTAASEWVNEPIPSLGGRKPMEMLGGTDEDQRRVFTILGRIEHGIF